MINHVQLTSPHDSNIRKRSGYSLLRAPFLINRSDAFLITRVPSPFAPPSSSSPPSLAFSWRLLPSPSFIHRSVVGSFFVHSFFWVMDSSVQRDIRREVSPMQQSQMYTRSVSHRACSHLFLPVWGICSYQSGANGSVSYPPPLAQVTSHRRSISSGSGRPALYSQLSIHINTHSSDLYAILLLHFVFFITPFTTWSRLLLSFVSSIIFAALYRASVAIAFSFRVCIDLGRASPPSQISLRAPFSGREARSVSFCCYI